MKFALGGADFGLNCITSTCCFYQGRLGDLLAFVGHEHSHLACTTATLKAVVLRWSSGVQTLFY